MPHGYQGPLELLANTHYWPQDVIVMLLANVGTNQGVNQALLTEVINRANHFNVYAAGGIRDIADLIMLKEMGLCGALVATALHHQQISSEALEKFA